MDVSLEELQNFIEPLANFRRKKVGLAEAPEFTQRLTSFLEVEVGKSASFIGQFKSILEANVKWFKEEEQLKEDSKHVFECVSQTGLVKLTILHLNRKDEGAYKCRVENLEGVATTTGYLSVIASKNRGNRKSSKRKCGTERVSSPPLLNPIFEQKSVEESEEKEYKTMPPSPLHDFLSSIRHSAKSMNAPIVYGNLENFNDILDMDSLTDDEEVFEVNKKGQRSSDEEDFSTEESSSSEAEPARTPTDHQSLPQMLGFAKNCDQRISKFTPVRVYTAAKKRLTTSKNIHVDAQPVGSNLANRPNSLCPEIKIIKTVSHKSETPINDVVSQTDDSQVEFDDHQPSTEAANHIEPHSFVQSSLSSNSRPLLLSSKFTQAKQKLEQNGSVNHVDRSLYKEWSHENILKCCLLISYVAVVTFISISFSITPLDVILFVGATSAVIFLKESADDQS